MAKGCSIALSGPSLVGSSTGAATTHMDLGGPEVTVKTSGLVNQLHPTEADTIAAIRTYLSYLPSNASLAPPLAD